jgi:hypothetical protein
MSSGIREFLELTSPTGARHLLVPAVHVEEWSETRAYGAVREALAEGGFDARDLTDLAVERGCRSREPEAVARFLADEVARGALTAISLPEPMPKGSYPVLYPRDRAPDWDNLRPLSDLRGKDPTMEWSWVSVEVLDHTGVPYAGLEITLVHGDGRRDRVVLDDAGRHTARGVPKDGRTKVYWPQRVELSAEAKQRPGLDGFQRMPEDVRVPRDSKGKWSNLDQMGRHYRLVVDPPTPTVSITAGQFAANSSFPTPGILVPLLGISFADFFADLGLPRTDPFYQVFGHAEPDGDEAANKALSDRRAKVFAALLVGDVDSVQAIADEEKWGLREQQVILRVLRCDPGAIDGEPGAVTSRAIEIFQAEYRDGVFHRHREGQDAPRNPSLAVNGAMDDATAHALIEAFVVATSPRVAPDRMHPTHPFAGCSEFNRLEAKASRRDRRLAIVMHDELPRDHDPQPCKEGDHGACLIDGRDPVKRCSWYRAHVIDPEPGEAMHRHFDLRWLLLPNKKLLLSAVTTVPDDGEVTFQVFRTKPISSIDELGDDALGEALCERKVGLIRGGIAQLVWEPPEGFSLFDLDTWAEPIAVQRGADAWNATQRARIPVFRVEGGGTSAISPPPGDDVGRLASELACRLSDEPLQDVLVFDAFGAIELRRLDHAATGRVEDGRHPLAPDELRVLGVRYATAFAPPDEEVPR